MEGGVTGKGEGGAQNGAAGGAKDNFCPSQYFLWLNHSQLWEGTALVEAKTFS